MKPLRICHVIHNTEFGGTETMLYQVVRQLSNEHEMCVVSLMRRGEIGERIEQLDVPVHAVNCVENRKPRPERLAGFVSHIRKFQPDVVQTWAYHADLCGGVAARLATKAAVLWNIRHATLDPKIDSKNVLRSAKLCGRLSGWVPDRILLNAQAAVDVHADAGYERKKMQVISNGFDVGKFQRSNEDRIALRKELRIPSDGLVVGMCGRFHPHKGQSQFVKVAKRLSAESRNAYFVIAGNRCDESNVELTTWVENAGLSDRFRLLGSRNDIPRVLSAMDAYLLPSVTEGMPNAIGEAMACNLPVVSTDVGDARRLLGDCGTVVPVDDVPAMAKSVGKVLRMDAEEREAQGHQARKRIVENFEIGVIASKYVDTWRETLDRRSSGKRTTVTMPASARATIPIGSPSSEFSLAAASQSSSAAPSRSSSAYRPKIVHVTTIPMTQWLFLRGQNQFMHQQGFDVHSVSSPGPYMPKLSERDPLTTHEVAITRQITPWRDLVSVYRLFRTFRQIRPEIVQLSTPKAALLGAIAAKAARVPVRIYQVRGLSSESESGAKRKVFQRFERITAQLCNGYLVNANSLLEYAKRANILKGGFVAGQGMSNGVDLQRFDPSKTEPKPMGEWDASWNKDVGPVIGYIGRLTRDKGTEDMFSVWRVLREEFPKARLLLVGPWESENATTKECRDALHADPRVIMTGMQNDVVGFYKNMDVFAFPSHGTEGFPNAPMEAAAMGLPVIATRVVGCVDAVVHNVTGKVISPRAPGELESALRAYMSDETLRQQHGAAGRNRIRTGFAPQDLWSEFHDYYLHLLRREGLPLPVADRDDARLPKVA